MIYLIEHLEKELYEWCFIEYKNISKIVGKDNLWFTNIQEKDIEKLQAYGKVSKESIKSFNLKKVCVLDPEAPKTLIPEDKNKFQYMIFGGILGDHPQRKRTQEELTPFIKDSEIRNIGKEQFSTDNAVLVTKKILDGIELEKMEFADQIEIKINDVESTILPYKYPLINGKPHISSELVEYIKRDDKI